MTQPTDRRQHGFFEPISGADLAGLDCWLAACRAEGLTERADVSQTWHVVTMSRPNLLPAPHRADYPLGKGFYVWELPKSAGGSPDLLVDKLLAQGCGWVLLKCHDGTLLHSGDLTPWIDACSAAQIDVWLWGYIYGNDPAGEARVAAARLEQFGIRGYMIDAEGEYKGKGAQATTFVQTLRHLRPAVVMGLSSFRFPSLHGTFPFAEFLAECAFHAPQLYWLLNSNSTAPGTQLARSIKELKAIKDLPFVPIGCAFPFQGWRPSVVQLNDFHAAALAQGCRGEGWWSFQSAEADAEFWATIMAHRWPSG